MVDSLYQRVGGLALPLDVTDITSAASFEATDPALETLSALFAGALRGEFGTGVSSAWYAVTSTLPASHRLYQSTNPVGAIWKVEPSATLMRQVKVGTWPLLTVWREGPAEYEQLTTMNEVLKQRWGCMWALGDLEGDLFLKLVPAITMAAKVIATTALTGRHPGYDSGTRQFGADKGWLTKLTVINTEGGAAKFSDDEESRFWAASVTLESLELVRDLEASDVGGTSLGVTIGTGGAVEILPEFVIGDGDYPG